jgi:hypothetical protein
MTAVKASLTKKPLALKYSLYYQQSLGVSNNPRCDLGILVGVIERDVFPCGYMRATNPLMVPQTPPHTHKATAVPRSTPTLDNITLSSGQIDRDSVLPPFYLMTRAESIFRNHVTL